ncbi:acyl-CoA thioesterase [Candidatus Bathyarchaeota archaeon]|nr:acyl-CoA thioesterase [Candidatus Bathyarchaeota archaeon]
MLVKFRVALPVQFRDIDRMGHVNHAVYLQYMETARVMLAKRLGMIRTVSSSSFIVAMAHVEYKQPIREEEHVTVTCWISRIGTRSWDLDYTVRSGRVENAIGRTTQVSYDYKTRKTVKISERLRKNLQKWAGKPIKFREIS